MTEARQHKREGKGEGGTETTCVGAKLFLALSIMAWTKTVLSGYALVTQIDD